MNCDIYIFIFIIIYYLQTLQHGAGEREGDVDGAAEERKGQEEGQAGRQGPLHLQDVPQV